MSDIKDSLENESVTVVQKKVTKRGTCRVCGRECLSYFFYGALCCEGLWGYTNLLKKNFLKVANNFSEEVSFRASSKNVPIIPIVM
jgi:hypothetical protein